MIVVDFEELNMLYLGNYSVYNFHMLNKVDKCFLISLIILILASVLPIVLSCLLSVLSFKFNFEIPNISDVIVGIVFAFLIINYTLVIPILLFMQIITFIIKILSKNKCKKDWLIIIFNFITVLFFGYIYLAGFLMVRTL